MTRIDARELAAHLDETLDRVARGERIVLERPHKPSVVLVPLGDLEADDQDDLPPPVETSRPITREFIDRAIREGRE